jgi:hypothetical protein
MINFSIVTTKANLLKDISLVLKRYEEFAEVIKEDTMKHQNEIDQKI